MVTSDGSVEVYIDNNLVQVIPADIVQNQNLDEPKKNIFPASTKTIHELIKHCITYLVQQQNNHEALKDFWFYNNRIKSAMKNEPLYQEVMSPKWKLATQQPYGVNYRTNRAG